MDEELIWECDMMSRVNLSRDNMTHLLVRYFSAIDSDTIAYKKPDTDNAEPLYLKK